MQHIVSFKRKILGFSFLCLLSLLSLFSAKAFSAPVLWEGHPLYFGLATGVGSTTWFGLVPSNKNQNPAILLSTPIQVHEGGLVYGLFAGFEVTRHFAIEANYWHYPDAEVIFSPDSLFAFDHDDRTLFRSATSNVGLLAKLMMDIPNTPFRVFSGAGVAQIYRSDEITTQSRISPTFVLGLNFNLSCHWMGQLGVNYIAGYGESQLNPANTYIPFLYSGYFGLAYKF
jgi:hypothetical protein